MTLAMTADHAEMAIAGLGLAVLYAAVFLGALWGLSALVGMPPVRPARQLAPIRVRDPALVRMSSRDRDWI